MLELGEDKAKLESSVEFTLEVEQVLISSDNSEFFMLDSPGVETEIPSALTSSSSCAVPVTSEKEFKVSTKIIQADFCEGEEIYATIAKEITDLEIGTLVNNVGISYSYPEYFLDANVASVTRMTGLALPGMVKRGKGVIINIGSASSIIPSPLLTVYAASKAYVDKFTEGLDMEYRKKGIICQCVMPGFVCTTMSGIRRSTFFAPTAEAFVKSAISLVGTVSRTTGYLPHAIFTNTISFIYDVSGSFGVWLVTRSMENTRNRSLKKYKKQ
ncbi:hypothetical protein MSG28_005727 [Choristoneura fumiferana]|uniref:Uncharacterized protein n=1 Tax=Choristoneura fumiferana TaxID=7141 RepID=A0ACC0L0W8_CHOFU|nr:hypothetical protein MSG28_005727 [Choristoneura fumiferana]